MFFIFLIMTYIALIALNLNLDSALVRRSTTIPYIQIQKSWFKVFIYCIIPFCKWDFILRSIIIWACCYIVMNSSSLQLNLTLLYDEKIPVDRIFWRNTNLIVHTPSLQCQDKSVLNINIYFMRYMRGGYRLTSPSYSYFHFYRSSDNVNTVDSKKKKL